MIATEAVFSRGGKGFALNYWCFSSDNNLENSYLFSCLVLVY
jgi:hypothetical protein